ncbi:MAG: HAD-IIA family hydrolase [Hydrogenibacillus sp.]|nr:HAD-IIA family hydrolase [Hydrogenibacillus sp.]
MRYRGMLIDLDGTLVRGSRAIPGADRFLQALREGGIPFLILTNNATRTSEAVAEALARIGFPVTAGDVLTSAEVLALWLGRRRPMARVLVVGEAGLVVPLRARGFSVIEAGTEAAKKALAEGEIDVVAVGLDRTLTYEKLVQALSALARGAAFYATNCDIRLPSEDGLLPGNGSIVELLRLVSARRPRVVGKPRAPMLRAALDVLGLGKEDVALVGDNMLTDIAAGHRFGIDAYLVETGVPPSERDLLRFPPKGRFRDLDALTAHLWSGA